MPTPESLPGRALVSRAVAGEVLTLEMPLSLWGGLDPESGTIIDPRHPQNGAVVTGRVLVLPIGRGSSSASSILLEAARLGTAPEAIVTQETDGILALGAAVAREMYESYPAVLVLEGEAYSRLQTGDHVEIREDGRIVLQGP
jgi:predicted aconitase with swiveling domain